jgi:hypothetical protein
MGEGRGTSPVERETTVFNFFFQLFRPEYYWRDLSSRNAHLLHQNWYRISFTLKKRRPQELQQLPMDHAPVSAGLGSQQGPSGDNKRDSRLYAPSSASELPQEQILCWLGRLREGVRQCRQRDTVYTKEFLRRSSPISAAPTRKWVAELSMPASYKTV